MTRIRRGLLLTALTVSIVTGAGTTTAAQATFGDTASVSVGTYSTVSVAAPNAVKATLTCGRTTTDLTLTWKASATPRVEAYVITVTFSDGVVQTTEVGPTATSWNTTKISPFSLTKPASARATVTARTDYKWTAESAPTGTIQC